MAHYRELIVHPNPVIQQIWMGAAENEFGRLFQGFEDYSKDLEMWKVWMY
jgi:hypothetical protein